MHSEHDKIKPEEDKIQQEKERWQATTYRKVIQRYPERRVAFENP